MDFKVYKGEQETAHIHSINLSILDFKDIIYTQIRNKIVSINLSILDFKDEKPTVVHVHRLL